MSAPDDEALELAFTVATWEVILRYAGIGADHRQRVQELAILIARLREDQG